MKDRRDKTGRWNPNYTADYFYAGKDMVIVGTPVMELKETFFYSARTISKVAILRMMGSVTNYH